MNIFKDDLLSKHGKITITLARSFMPMKEGDRIETIGQISERLNIGRGTVQSALKKIQSSNALKLKSRGHLGTYITFIDYEKLWKIADIGIVTGVMPLPYSLIYEGIATGLYKVFQELNIPFNLAYMRGPIHRMEALEKNLFSFAIVSKIAAKEKLKDSESLEIIDEFNDNTYSGEHVVLLRSKYDSVKDGFRIAVDNTSIDQMILTEYEFKDKNIKLVDIPYNQIPKQMELGNIDATIWRIDENQLSHPLFRTMKLESPEAKEIIKNETKAVVVGCKSNREINNVLSKVIDMKKIEVIQDKVINKEIIPIF